MSYKELEFETEQDSASQSEEEAHEWTHTEVLEEVRKDMIFEKCRPQEEDIRAASSYIVEEAPLAALEDFQVQKKQVVPEDLEKAIAVARRAHEGHNKDSLELEDLSMFADDDGGKAGQDRLNRIVYKHLAQTEKTKYDADGIVDVGNGGANFAIGAAVQCLLAVRPLKDYLVQQEYEYLGIPKPNIERRELVQRLSEVFRGAFQK